MNVSSGHPTRGSMPGNQRWLRNRSEGRGRRGGGLRTSEGQRREQLLASDALVERVRSQHAPIGLELGGNDPSELALSIAAELVAVRRGGSGRPMREVRPIMAATGQLEYPLPS